MAGTLIVSRQMEFIESRELGFEDSGIIALYMQGDELLGRYEVLRDRLEQNPNVESVSTLCPVRSSAL